MFINILLSNVARMLKEKVAGNDDNPQHLKFSKFLKVQSNKIETYKESISIFKIFFADKVIHNTIEGTSVYEKMWHVYIKPLSAGFISRKCEECRLAYMLYLVGMQTFFATFLHIAEILDTSPEKKIHPETKIYKYVCKNSTSLIL